MALVAGRTPAGLFGPGRVTCALLLALTAAAGCGGETAAPAPGPMVGHPADAATMADAELDVSGAAEEPGDAQPEPGADVAGDVPSAGKDVAAAPDVAPDLAPDLAPDGAPDLRPDVRPDRGPLTQEERYREFLEDATVAISNRGTACFHSPPIDPSLPGPTSGLWVSLRNGFSTVNETAAAACLAAIAKATCDELAADDLGDACSTVLTGHVANGHYCRIDDDCTESSQNFCKFEFGTACGSRCAPRAKAGDPCSDVCTTDTYCASIPTGNRCSPLVTEGKDCGGGECAAGLFCQRTGEPSGKCRRITAGLACAGTWQCPGSYACLVPAGASVGVCGPGHALAEACRVLESGGVVDSDCAPGLRCLPGAGGKLTCTLGHEVGESCAIPDGVTVAGEPCRVGYCKDGVKGLVCTARRQLAQPCSDDNPCDTGLACDGTCVPAEIASGGVCGGVEERKCEQGTFCKSATPGAAGVCAPLRPEGESCLLEECAPPGDCQNNVCARCL
jgi:hypothetical protein